MTGHSVVIAGAGPAGMMLAAELALAGVDVGIVERRTGQELESSRAGGLHARTIEVLDQRGVADRFVTAGQTVQRVGFAGVSLDISDFPSRHNYTLALWQSRCEQILGDWVAELSVPVYRELEVTGFRQDAGGVDVSVSDGTVLRAEWLVGCDGARSVVRRAAGIEFAGWDPSISWLTAEAETTQEPEYGLRPGGGIGRSADGARARFVLAEPYVEGAGEATLEDLRAALAAADGTDYGVHDAAWVSRFNDMSRQAVDYRRGRVLLAGDAAHIRGPQGGQGLNTAVQDSVNLGWKLGQVVKGVSPEGLLDSYQAERHPVGARVMQNTMAQVALLRTDERTAALHELVSGLLELDEPRRQIAGMISGLDIHYDLGGGYPLVGRRMPDLDLVTADGVMRVFGLLHEARGVLLNLGEPKGFDVGPWVGRVRVVEARYDGEWELPVLGRVGAPGSVLIRPDGHVAWTGELSDPGLAGALTTWFGEAGAG